mgnify:CR=1 FL=1
MNGRTRQYEAKSVILEAKVEEVSMESTTRGSFTKLLCEVTASKHRNFNYMSGKQATIYRHISGLPNFRVGDRLMVYTTPKGIEDLTIKDSKRIDKVDEHGSMISRYFC